MTEIANFNKAPKKPRILVAPLEWGLGHATRCIPIIHELIHNGCEVLIAADGGPRALLLEEFPSLQFIPLLSYNVRYSSSGKGLALKVIKQVPKIITTIFKEHAWVKRIAEEYKIDGIISDNRFGLYHPTIPCIYITHQLQIKTGNVITDSIVRKLNLWFISKYKECWVPDYEKEPGMAGELSHLEEKPSNVVYIGCLSRFEKLQNIETKYDLLISMSGPEPQRSMFEKKMIEQAKDFPGKVLLLRGLPGNNVAPLDIPENIEVKNHLKGEALSEAMQSSEWMISRSGYTTIMDILKIQRKTILIPTPGQTEQEYLAKSLSLERMFFTARQEDFSLAQTMRFAAGFPLVTPYYDMEIYKPVVERFVRSLQK